MLMGRDSKETANLMLIQKMRATFMISNVEDISSIYSIMSYETSSHSWNLCYLFGHVEIEQLLQLNEVDDDDQLLKRYSFSSRPSNITIVTDVCSQW